MKSELFEQDKMEKEGAAGSFLLQNRHTLKVELDGEVYAKQSSMAAYQGNVDFSYHGGGVHPHWHGTGSDLIFWDTLRSASQRADICGCASGLGLVDLTSN